MADPPANAITTSNFLSTHAALLDTLVSFLTVATHHILYLRRLYPPISFLSARAYNYPVRQNRHPAVCRWINDAVSAVRDQLEKNAVERVSLCIYECTNNRVLERWTFDLHSLPTIARSDTDVPFDFPAAAAATTTTTVVLTTAAEDDPESGAGPSTVVDELGRTVNVADLEAHFRATLSRISTAAGRLEPLPEGPGAPECSFTLAIELKDHADRPVGRIDREERKWMATEPEPEPEPEPERQPEQKPVPQPQITTTATTRSASSHSAEKQLDVQNQVIRAPAKPQPPRTHAIRRLEAGELRMEVWVEESAAKFELAAAQGPKAQKQTTREQDDSSSAAKHAAKMSYGAGTDKFDPENQYPYDLEPPDVNRKPQGGAMTDYQRG